MTIEKIPGTEVEYYLISYDDDGKERNDPEGVEGKLSRSISNAMINQDVTDVFLISHGWKGDVPAAIDQYQRWIGAMLECHADRQTILEVVPAFKSLLVGIHWPSLPWGEEDHPPADSDVGFAPHSLDLTQLRRDAALRIADSNAAQVALDTIFESAANEPEPAKLPAEVAEAFSVLAHEAGLEGRGLGAPPGEDGEPFDPERAYLATQAGDDADVSFGVFDGVKRGVLGVLRQLSFWTMKKRACTIGERGAGNLLRSLQVAVPADRTVRFHLMGHSFGCIVISAAVCGRADGPALTKPVDAVYLVQGALSFWSYCDNIPDVGSLGYFKSVIDNVAGPLVVTHSVHDTAVGKLYPIAAGLAGQVDFDSTELPRYGALGTFGARGPGVDPIDLVMGDIDASYPLQNRRVHNVESDSFINQGGGASGAHNDIDKPAVAHVFWCSVLKSFQGASA